MTRNGHLPEDDPTRVRNQPALRGSGPLPWLLPAGLLGAIATAVFALSIPIAPVIASVGIALQIGFFVAMIVMAVAKPSGRPRSRAFAVAMGAMALSALVLMLVILAIAWSAGLA